MKNAKRHLAFGIYILGLLVGLVATPSTQAQTFTTLHSFDNTDGANPVAGLVQATNGSLYGTMPFGGANGADCPAGCGTVFKISLGGTLTTLYSFCAQSGCADGFRPNAALVQATNGNFYGTTISGGANSGGTIFKISPGGALTTLYDFCSQSGCTDGGGPLMGLVQATDGNLYGTAGGGVNGFGTVFKITPTGALTTLYSFCSQSSCPDGENPQAGLVQATDGNFYGTTSQGGAAAACIYTGLGGCGTVFKIARSGKLTTLYSFCSQSGCTDGLYPFAGLVQATDGNLYGTTSEGGASNPICTSGGCGTVFKITPSGTLTTLYTFCSQSGCTDGSAPFAGLVQGTDGNFYGVTQGGGAGGACTFTAGCGTVFQITPSGTLTTLYSFCSQHGCTDGSIPYTATLVQHTNGNFYWTTLGGGTSLACGGTCGTVFSLSVGLGALVETQPTFGRVGKTVKILGTNLTGATSVSFNGTAATFTVVSSSLITTTVPAGATTGKVQVVTPSGTLSSNVPFRVLP